jgi:hypothetical protein
MVADVPLPSTACLDHSEVLVLSGEVIETADAFAPHTQSHISANTTGKQI